VLDVMTARAPSKAVLDRIARTTAAGLELDAELGRFCDEARDVLRAFDQEVALCPDECQLKGVSRPLDDVHALIARMHDVCRSLFQDAFAGGAP
jgi:hypothetical protein